MSLFDIALSVPPAYEPKWASLIEQLTLTRGQDWSLLGVMNDFCGEFGHDELAATLRYCARWRYAPKCSEGMKSIVWFQRPASEPEHDHRPWELAPGLAYFVSPRPSIAQGTCKCKSLLGAYLKIAYARREIALVMAITPAAAESMVLV